MVKNGVYDIKVGGDKRKFLHCPISTNFDFVHEDGHGRDLRRAMDHMTTGMHKSCPYSLSSQVKALIHHRGEIRVNQLPDRDYHNVTWVLDLSDMYVIPIEIRRVFESLARTLRIQTPIGGILETAVQELGKNLGWYLRDVFQAKIEEAVNRVFHRYVNRVMADADIRHLNEGMFIGAVIRRITQHVEGSKENMV